MIQIGMAAPDFTAKAYENGEFKEVSLSDYRDKWVFLFFYPGDFTFVCVTEIAAIVAKFEAFSKLGVQVLGISMDSIYVHKMWDEQEISKMTREKMPFPLLADTCGEIGKSYGVYSASEGFHLRGSFIINPHGIVQSMEVVAPSVGREFDETLRQIEAHQHVCATKGCQVTPTSWKPGQQALEPTTALVGKVWETWTPEFYYKSSK